MLHPLNALHNEKLNRKQYLFNLNAAAEPRTPQFIYKFLKSNYTFIDKVQMAFPCLMFSDTIEIWKQENS